jgi:hypothetical protein
MRYDKAIDAHARSLSSSQSDGNKDLEVYSLLGLCLSFGATGKWPAFHARLAELQACLSYEAPVERAYAEVLSVIAARQSHQSVEADRKLTS